MRCSGCIHAVTGSRHGPERRDPGAARRRSAAARLGADGIRPDLGRARRAAAVRRDRPRGTSDNAGIYAQYLLAIRNGLIVALAAPSTITLYGARPNMADALVVGISQSGRSPDIVAVVEEARRQGALTVALTNDTDSPLAETADHVIDLRAGPELATAATKTYTTELLAAALLSTALDRLRQRKRSTWPDCLP